MMKGLLLSAFCLVFLFLSLSINEALASIIKTIIAWGCFVFLSLTAWEIWKLKYGAGKESKWDEDP
ncbi:MAG: hypothetical protein ACOX4H_08050 [Bacillota bacterium]|jgi:hypothetical protein|nr:hypothetical protein [Clostridia bacterium]